MNKKVVLLFISIISLILNISVANASTAAFANASVTLNHKNTSSFTDDELTVSGISISETSYAYVSKNTYTQTEACVANLPAGAAGGSYQLESAGSGNYKIKITEQALTDLEKANDKIYVTFYLYNSNYGCYDQANNPNIAVNTAPATVRFKDANVSATDGVVKITNVYLPSVTNFEVVVSEKSNEAASSSNTTPLTGTSNNYSIDKTFFKEKIKTEEYLYLSVYKDSTLVGGPYAVATQKGEEIFKNVTFSFFGNTDSDQTKTSIKTSSVSVALPGEIYAFFSKKADTNDLGHLQAVDGTSLSESACSNGSELEPVAVVNDSYFELKDPKCYLYFAQQNGDTYITLYRKVDNYTPDGISASSQVEYYLKKITASKKINRPANLEVGKRVHIDISPTTSQFYMLNLSTSDIADLSKPLTRTAEYRIGLIEDKTILRNIRDNKSGAYADLLEYAKKGKYINSGQIKIYPNAESIKNVEADDGALYSQSKMVEGAYYYFLIDYDGEENLYPFQEVQLFSTKKNDAGIIEFVTKENTNWEGLGSDETEKEKKNPKTGIASYTLITLTIAFAGIVIYIKTRKVTKFPQS